MWKTFLYATLVPLLAVSAFGIEPGKPDEAKANKSERLDITSGWWETGGHVTSRTPIKNGKPVLHGLQVLLGPENKLRELAVFNKGKLESRTQYYPNREVFRSQTRMHDGSGDEIVFGAERNVLVIDKVFDQDGKNFGPIKTTKVICRGTIKNDKLWDGDFLRWEQIPNGFGFRLMMQTYRQGKLAESTPFDEKKLNLPRGPSKHTDIGAWPWRWDHHADQWPTAE